jgi:ribonuclease HII
MLKSSFTDQFTEAGCDEAGRGCLAGPVFAAAVIFPKGYENALIKDSKKLSASERNYLRVIIENEALDWAVASIDNDEIDRINILNASILAMHKALEKLTIPPELLLIDGNRFKPFLEIPFHTIIKGDAIYLSIAAASILAKTHRDEYMTNLHESYPHYGWESNKGYPTLGHRKTILSLGLTKYHRRTFTVQVKSWE